MESLGVRSSVLAVLRTLQPQASWLQNPVDSPSKYYVHVHVHKIITGSLTFQFQYQMQRH